MDKNLNTAIPSEAQSASAKPLSLARRGFSTACITDSDLDLPQPCGLETIQTVLSDPDTVNELRQTFGSADVVVARRIAKTIAFLETFKPEQIDGTEDKDIVVKRGEKETHYKGMQYLLGHGLPNLYFHTTTTYSMLRAGGVEIGKSDYLGKI